MYLFFLFLLTPILINYIYLFNLIIIKFLCSLHSFTYNILCLYLKPSWPDIWNVDLTHLIRAELFLNIYCPIWQRFLKNKILEKMNHGFLFVHLKTCILSFWKLSLLNISWDNSKSIVLVMITRHAAPESKQWYYHRHASQIGSLIAVILIKSFSVVSYIHKKIYKNSL